MEFDHAHTLEGSDNVVAKQVEVGGGLAVLYSKDHECFRDMCVSLLVRGDSFTGDNDAGYLTVETEKIIVLPVMLAHEILPGFQKAIVDSLVKRKLMELGVNIEGYEF